MKLDDIPFIVRDLNNEMPVHTSKTTKVPTSYFTGLPKNLMEHSTKMDNKFLNNHLAEIEEVYHRFPKMHSRMFEEYQIRKYLNRDILNHDGFFSSEKVKDYIATHKGSMVRGASQVKLEYDINTLHPPVGGGCTSGSDVEVGGTDLQAGVAANFVLAIPITLVNVRCYDRLAINMDTTSNNNRLGLYDEVSSLPENLMAESGSNANDLSFTWHSTSEWTTSQTAHWIGLLFDVTSTINYNASGNYEFVAHTYGAYPDPIGTPTSGSNIDTNQKIGHS